MAESHPLIRHIATLDEWLYLVLEDDYQLPDKWQQQLETLLSEIRDDWDILKLHSSALNGKPRLRGFRVSKHLARLGPVLLTQQNLSGAAYVVRHRAPRTAVITRAIEDVPVMHFDDALNVVMGEIRFYAPLKQFGGLTPLSAVSTR